uniref:Beta-hexosaminidase n=1 Tax=Lagenidium giganteum TaxID=4803 RepID=A0A1D8QLR0_9STRA|nr:glycoside hydrolase 20 [Lagenidium giganteum]
MTTTTTTAAATTTTATATTALTATTVLTATRPRQWAPAALTCVVVAAMVTMCASVLLFDSNTAAPSLRTHDATVWAPTTFAMRAHDRSAKHELAPRPSFVPVWPMPQTFQRSDDARARLQVDEKTLTLTTKIADTTTTIPTLEAAWAWYRDEVIFAKYRRVQSNSATTLGNSDASVPLVITVEDGSEAAPQLDTAESYELQVTQTSGIAIKAATVYGAVRALETLSQLIRFDTSTSSYAISHLPVVVTDSPRFAHRGLLIDTSRHFLAIPTILRALDSMAFAKLNVLHWHLSDEESFPLQSFSHPNLWNSAYSPVERYTQNELAFVVEYARVRGIRVMFELDVPGHAASWCVGEPSVCPSTTCRTPLNVANNYTFQVIQDVLEEVTGGGIRAQGLFPYDLLHLGGDEVDTRCWDSVPSVSQWLQDQQFSANDAYKYFVDRANAIARQLQRRPVMWVEVFEQFRDKLHPSTIVHVWKDKQSLAEVLAAGYHALLSNQHDWYLDHLATSWQNIYQNEPFDGIDDEEQQARVLGGEAAMWGETVDGSDFENTVWPRLAAFAERMWSVETLVDLEDAEIRIHHFRCVLLMRGVAAAPVSNQQARNAPPHYGSCIEQ